MSQINKTQKGEIMNIYLLNGTKEFGHSKGELNTTLHNLAKQTLSELGHQIKEVIIDQGYEIAQEVENLKWADCLIYQFPVWWMGEPWIVKKYIDEIYIADTQLFANDGRSQSDLSKKYGSGGLAQNKSYMLCSTWNAPLEAFTDKDQFFGAFGVEGIFVQLDKTHQFCGMQKLPSFMCNDVIKDPQVNQYLTNYKTHLIKIFG